MQHAGKWAIAAAAAVLAAPAIAADGEARIYGDFRYALIHSDAEGSPADTDLAGTNAHAGVSLRVSEGDYSATVVYERTLANDDSVTQLDSVRQSYLQVGSPYGTVIYGRAPTAYKVSGEKLDPFFNTGIGTISGAGFADAPAPVLGPNYGLSALTSDTVGNGFINNQIAYVSPTLYGVTLNGAVFISENAGDNEDHDFGLGAEWNHDAITAGVQYLNLESTLANNPNANFNAGLPVPAEALRFYGGYKAETWGVSASWEPIDLKNGGLDRDYYFGAGWLKVLPQTTVAASYGNTEGTPFEGDSLSLGVFHELFSSLEVYLAARHTDRDAGVSSADYVAGINFGFSLAHSGTF